MAKKVNMLKLAYVSRWQAEFTSRRRASEAALYLIQLQSPGWKIPALKKKLTVIMDDETRAQTEYPVKIIHAG
jgi:hypothetical protein